MKKFIITLLENLLAKLKPQPKKTIKYRFLEILKSKGKSKRKDLVNFVLMAQHDTRNNVESPYNPLLYKDVSRGYYCTNLATWLNRERVIQKDKDGYYTVSSTGLTYLKNPKAVRFANLKKKYDIALENNERMNYMLNAVYNRLDLNDVWESLVFWKGQGFREELTRDKRQYLDCLIGFAEDCIGRHELKARLGKEYEAEDSSTSIFND